MKNDERKDRELRKHLHRILHDIVNDCTDDYGHIFHMVPKCMYGDYVSLYVRELAQICKTYAKGKRYTIREVIPRDELY